MRPPDSELLAQYLADELSASQSQHVQLRLGSEPAFADELIRLSRSEAIIQEWATVYRGPVPIYPAQEKHPHNHWIREATAIAAVLVACVATGLIFVRQRDPNEAEHAPVLLAQGPILERVDGDAYLITDAGPVPVQVGQQLRPGDRVETAMDGEVTMRMPDSGMLEVGTDSSVRMMPTDSEARVFLEHGSVHAEPSGQQVRPMVVASPTGNVFGLFAFSLATDRDESKLTADNGPASLTRTTDGETTNVPMGQYQTTKANAPQARTMPPSERWPARTLAFPAGPVRAMTISPDGRSLGAITSDYALELRDFATDEKVKEHRDHDRARRRIRTCSVNDSETARRNCGAGVLALWRVDCGGSRNAKKDEYCHR